MRRPLCSSLLLLLSLASPAAAQRRGDQARLSFGIGLGYNGATDIWHVDAQELIDNLARDTASIFRNVRPTIGITFIGVYYPDPHWGLTGEAHLIGLGYSDGCMLRSSSGSSQNQQVCTSINGNDSPGTAVAMTVGGIYRPFAWTDIQPYLRANIGLLVSQQSAIRMKGTFTRPDSQGVDYYVYQDKHPASVAPAAGLAAGITAFVGRSYQMRFEVKDNLVSLEHVLAAVSFPSAEPRSERRLHHVFSMTVAVEVVLERKRGRRY
ncbi:MAG: hypothetical protein ABJB33_04920 [Gemmatimonadota bacterium]